VYNEYDVEVKTCYVPVVLTVIVTVVNLLWLLTNSVWSTHFFRCGCYHYALYAVDHFLFMLTFNEL